MPKNPIRFFGIVKKKEVKPIDRKHNIKLGLLAILFAPLIFGILVQSVIAAPSGISEMSVINEAYSWRGVPYLLGGESKAGVDCSGLVRQVYIRASGYHAYYYDRSAEQIRQRSYAVYPPRPGDVIIFKDKQTGVCTHVGLYILQSNYGYGDCYFIHAGQTPGRVVLDRLYYSPYYGTGWWYSHFNMYFARYNPDFWTS